MTTAHGLLQNARLQLSRTSRWSATRSSSSSLGWYMNTIVCRIGSGRRNPAPFIGALFVAAADWQSDSPSRDRLQCGHWPKASRPAWIWAQFRSSAAWPWPSPVLRTRSNARPWALSVSRIRRLVPYWKARLIAKSMPAGRCRCGLSFYSMRCTVH